MHQIAGEHCIPDYTVNCIIYNLQYNTIQFTATYYVAVVVVFTAVMLHH